MPRRSGELLAHTIGSLINGVSQQPPTVRLTSQAEEQINMLSQVDRGVSRRPCTTHIQKIMDAIDVPAKGWKIHIIDRDEAEQYIAFFESGDVRVFNLLTGNECTVNTLTTAASDYLDIDAGTASADEAYSMVSVADFTFVTNKDIAVAMSGNTSAVQPNQFLLYFDEAQNDQDAFFDVNLGAASASIEYNLTDNEGHYPGELVEFMMSANDAGNGKNTGIFNSTKFPRWTFTQVGQTVIYGEQTTTSGGADDISVSFEFSDESYNLITTSVQRFSELPSRGLDGFLVEVIGTDGDENTNYWVQFDGNSQVWKETVGPAQDDNFDAETMPHALTRDSGTGDTAVFSFTEQAWDARGKGDADAAPEPSFVGQTIADVVFHRNRLGFISEENTILSEAGEFFNFWPTTVTTVVDSDPIDAASSSVKVALLDHAVPFDKVLYLFSGHAGKQFVLTGGDTLSTKNADVTEASSYSASLRARPISVGDAIYFVDERGGVNAGLHELVIVDNSAVADDVAAHVPSYIPGNVVELSASEAENIITLRSSDEPANLYVYRYFFNRGDKVQSSWSRWEFGDDDTILAAQWVGSKLYVVTERGDGVHLSQLDIRQTAQGAMEFPVYLDDLFTVSGTYDAGLDVTTFVTPYDATLADGTYKIILTHADWAARVGVVLDPDALLSASVTIDGDYSDAAVHIGRVAPWEYEFTEPLLESPSASSTASAPSSPITQGRLQIRRWKVLLRDVGAFEARVNHKEDPAEQTYVYEYSGQTFGQDNFGPIEVTAEDEFRYDILGDARHVRNRLTGSNHHPFTLVAAEWEGYYVARAARI